MDYSVRTASSRLTVADDYACDQVPTSTLGGSSILLDASEGGAPHNGHGHQPSRASSSGTMLTFSQTPSVCRYTDLMLASLGSS